MNNPAQGQPTPGQPSGAQPPRPHIFRPEHMRQLPDMFTAEEKQKWEQGLKQLYAQIENNPKEAQQHIEAKRKLFEFSKTLNQKIQTYRAQQHTQQTAQQAQQAQQAGGARPSSQGQPQVQAGDNGSQDTNAAQQARPQPKISQKIMDHVNAFPYVLPPQLQQGTPEALKWIGEAKSRYVKGLVAMESATARIHAIDTMLQKRNEEGKPLSPDEEKDFKEKKEVAQKQHADASKFVESFRNSQQQQRAARDASQQGNAPQPAGNGNANVGQAPVRPPMNMQQQPPSTNPALQNTQTVNAAIEAARNQQMGGGRPPMLQNGQAPQVATQIPTQNAPSHPNIPQHQGGQVQNIKQEAGIPQMNTAANQGHPMSNSPQPPVPQSATSQQVPRPLTHQAALQTVARTYSSGQSTGTPNVMGHSHPHPPPPRETPNVATNKMPIPKHLHEKATAPPQPVAMPQSRPSFSGGPSNSSSGALSQPVLQKTPGYLMDGDGDRVLSKKKLDELVRQVTGGGEGFGPGEGLTPEVEESILNVADSFVDQVLQSACKNAKERGSKVLEIRDIQLTLERGYNIRIPGYASDEIRTVRKIQPSPAWISKMSAVQAAKVTGGKNAD